MEHEFLLSTIIKKHAETLKAPLEYEDFVNLNSTVAEEFEAEDEEDEDEFGPFVHLQALNLQI